MFGKAEYSYQIIASLLILMVVTIGVNSQLSAKDIGKSRPPKIDVLHLDDDDKDLITGSVMRDSQMLKYCLNISDAATETRTSILKEKLEAIETRVDKKLGQLSLQIEILKKWTTKREKFLKLGKETLVKIFQSMRPDAAAEQLAEIGPVMAAALILKLEPKYSSAILTEMKPAVAAKIAMVLASATEINDPENQ